MQTLLADAITRDVLLTLGSKSVSSARCSARGGLSVATMRVFRCRSGLWARRRRR